MKRTIIDYCSECDAEVEMEIEEVGEHGRVLWELLDITHNCEHTPEHKTDWEWARDKVENGA